MGRGNKRNIYLMIAFTILCIACFPANPLVLTGIIEVQSYNTLSIIGFIVWGFGMVLVMAPIVMFPRKGGVPKGKSFIKTTHLVDSGVFAVVRHPQYTGGIYALFITTLLLYPHWLFAVLGSLGTMLTVLSIKEEDKLLIEKFGEDYVAYMKRVPGMNIFLGAIRLLRKRKNKKE